VPERGGFTNGVSDAVRYHIALALCPANSFFLRLPLLVLNLSEAESITPDFDLIAAENLPSPVAMLPARSARSGAKMQPEMPTSEFTSSPRSDPEIGSFST
jgi:hypothetical protein